MKKEQELDTNKIVERFINAMFKEDENKKPKSIITKLQDFANENDFIVIDYKQNVHDTKVNEHNTVTFTLATQKIVEKSLADKVEELANTMGTDINSFIENKIKELIKSDCFK